MRSLTICFAVLWMSTLAGPATALIINNGLAPPNPENVIDSDLGSSTTVFVENSPAGDPTIVALVDGGRVGDNLWVRDSSTITMSGGEVRGALYSGQGSIEAFDTASVILTGGLVLRSPVLQKQESSFKTNNKTIVFKFEFV